ncbi:uncharacterized protein LOC101862488 isoform X2 [Aplysia californica]|uniref:Uncharacterized protein LOC101862488 isoform X2 n=1 Tax=Aplysia californica TaxID=6500 RepID=A0ABM0ZWJ9_APLCA|nr:uncharacterized protein LOC101862488 isoform X2 [Aplysia californica]
MPSRPPPSFSSRPGLSFGLSVLMVLSSFFFDPSITQDGDASLQRLSNPPTSPLTTITSAPSGNRPGNVALPVPREYDTHRLYKVTEGLKIQITCRVPWAKASLARGQGQGQLSTLTLWKLSTVRLRQHTQKRRGGHEAGGDVSGVDGHVLARFSSTSLPGNWTVREPVHWVVAVRKDPPKVSLTKPVAKCSDSAQYLCMAIYSLTAGGVIKQQQLTKVKVIARLMRPKLTHLQSMDKRSLTLTETFTCQIIGPESITWSWRKDCLQMGRVFHRHYSAHSDNVTVDTHEKMAAGVKDCSRFESASTLNTGRVVLGQVCNVTCIVTALPVPNDTSRMTQRTRTWIGLTHSRTGSARSRYTNHELYTPPEVLSMGVGLGAATVIMVLSVACVCVCCDDPKKQMRRKLKFFEYQRQRERQCRKLGVELAHRLLQAQTLTKAGTTAQPFPSTLGPRVVIGSRRQAALYGSTKRPYPSSAPPGAAAVKPVPNSSRNQPLAPASNAVQTWNWLSGKSVVDGFKNISGSGQPWGFGKFYRLDASMFTSADDNLIDQNNGGSFVAASPRKEERIVGNRIGVAYPNIWEPEDSGVSEKHQEGGYSGIATSLPIHSPQWNRQQQLKQQQQQQKQQQKQKQQHQRQSPRNEKNVPPSYKPHVHRYCRTDRF